MPHRKRRKLSRYNLFMRDYLRARLRPGMPASARRDALRAGARAWKAATRGRNPEEIEDLWGERESMSLERLPEDACPLCGHRLHASHEGERITCPGCGAVLVAED